MTSLLHPRWLAGIALPVTMFVLMTRLAGLSTATDGPSSPGRWAALVTCVLPADPGQAQFATPPARTTAPEQLDCHSEWVDPLGTPRVSAC